MKKGIRLLISFVLVSTLFVLDTKTVEAQNKTVESDNPWVHPVDSNSKIVSKVTATASINVARGTKLSKDELLKLANVKASYYDGKKISNAGINVNFNHYNRDKLGTYPVTVTVVETDIYHKSEVTVNVNVVNFDVIKDAGFKKCLNENYLNRSATTKINTADLKYIEDNTRQISCEHYGIKDLAGVEYLTGISHFYFSENEITSLAPLRNLTGINGLYIADNNISDLSPLKKLSKLGSLSMRRNKISDVSLLADLPNLKNVYFDGNNIPDISMLGAIRARGGHFNFANQNIVWNTVFLSEKTPSIFKIRNVNNKVHADVQAKIADFENGRATYTGNFYDSYGFSGKYTVNAIVGKAVPNITAKDIEVYLGTNLTKTKYMEESGLNVAYLNTNEYAVDLSKVDTSKIGTYDVTVNVPESDKSFSGSKKFQVTVKEFVKDDVSIAANDPLFFETYRPLTKDNFLAQANIKINTSSGKVLDNSLAEIDFSKVDTNTSGKYPVTIKVKATATTNAATKTINVYIGKLNTNINAESFSINIGEDLSDSEIIEKSNLKITLSDGTVVDNSVAEITAWQVDTDKVGTYMAYITVPETAMSKRELKRIYVTVNKMTSSISANNITIKAGTALTTSELIAKSGLKITLNNGMVLDNSVARVDLKQVNTKKAGTYDAKITVQNTSKYYGKTATIKVTVEKLTTSISTKDFAIDVEKALTANELIAKSGLKITLSDGTVLNNSVAKIDLSQVDTNKLGTYDAVITVPTTDKYAAKSVVVKVTVVKAKPSISTKDFAIDAGKTLTPNEVIAKSGLKVTLSNGKVVDNSVAQIDVSNVKVNEGGVYDVAITIPATAKYVGANAKVKVTVNKLTPSINTKDFLINLGSKLTKADVLTKSNLKLTLSDGTVLDNSIVQVDVSKVNTNVAGTYDIGLTVPTTAKYVGVSAKVKVTVNKLTASISAKDFTLNPLATLTKKDFIAKSGLEVKLNDGTVVNNILDDNLVEIYFNGLDTSVPGTYNVLVEVPTTNKYVGTSTTIKVTVSKYTLRVIGLDFNVEKGEQLTTDDFISNSSLVIGVSDGTFLDNNVAKIDLSQVDTNKPGVYDVAITVPATAKYASTTTTVKVTVNKLISTVKANNFAIDAGKALTKDYVIEKSGLEITLNDGTKVNNNVAQVNVSTVNTKVPGTYDLKITVPETDMYKGKTITVGVTVNKYVSKISAENFEIYVGDDLTADRVIYDSFLEVSLNDGRVLDNSNVQIAVDMQDVIETKAGTYDVVITVPETDEYLGSSITIEVTVIKAQALIIAKDFTIDVGTLLTKDFVIEKSNLSLRLGNGVLLDNSLAIIDLSNVNTNAVGDYIITIKIAETDNYLGNEMTVKLTVT